MRSTDYAKTLRKIPDQERKAHLLDKVTHGSSEIYPEGPDQFVSIRSSIEKMTHGATEIHPSGLFKC